MESYVIQTVMGIIGSEASVDRRRGRSRLGGLPRVCCGRAEQIYRTFCLGAFRGGLQRDFLESAQGSRDHAPGTDADPGDSGRRLVLYHVLSRAGRLR